VTWYRLLLHAYPLAFRQRFGQDLEELFADVYRSRAAGLPRSRLAMFWCRIAFDTIHGGLAERLNRQRRLPLRVHHARGPSTMSLLIDDMRHAFRALRQQRTLSAVILVTLALAIGANSAIFTVVNAVLLRPLPYADPDRVVMLYMVDRTGADRLLSLPDYEDFRASLKTITGLSPMGTQTANLTGLAEPDRLRAGFVGADFFTMLGVQPIIGRGFVAGEDAPGAPKTAMLDYQVWQTRFGADPAVIGRALVLNNEPHEVIGILPPRFEFPIAENEVWIPFSSMPVLERARSSRNWMIFGRLAPDASAEQAQAELRQAAAAMALAYPETNAAWTARIEGIHQLSVMFVRRNLQLLLGAVAFVLLIACANIANLLLARASARQREIAVRAALGASRGRIVRQLLLESTVLALVGGGIGLVLGAALTDGMLALLPNLPRLGLVRPDGVVIAFTAALSIATGIVFGLIPAARLSRPDLRLSLSEGSRGGESRGAGRVRSALIVAELALSLVLLAGAGLFIQSLTRLVNVDLGYDPANVLTLEYRLPGNKYAQPDDQIAFHQRIVDQLSSVPGVQRAAIARSVPQSGNRSYVGFWRSEDATPSPETMPRAQFNAVTDGFFQVMGIALLEGRACATTTDRADGAPVVIVNRLLAERLWPGESAVGKRLRTPEIPADVAVIGVVGNTRPNLLSQPVAPQMYGCLSQQPGIFATVAIKAAGEPLALTRSAQQAIWSVDPDQPMWKIRSAESMISASVQRDRFVMLLMLCAAGLALLLAALGTYSVLSYTVQRRAREVGVRIALGATRTNIIRLVLGQTVVLTAAGVSLGVAGALALGRVVATQLYDVCPRDPTTLAVTALTLAAVALVAAWLPARRAMSVDPVVTLRAE
jgi:putative ABC transport system permease protein